MSSSIGRKEAHVVGKDFRAPVVIVRIENPMVVEIVVEKQATIVGLAILVYILSASLNITKINAKHVDQKIN